MTNKTLSRSETISIWAFGCRSYRGPPLLPTIVYKRFAPSKLIASQWSNLSNFAQLRVIPFICLQSHSISGGDVIAMLAFSQTKASKRRRCILFFFCSRRESKHTQSCCGNYNAINDYLIVARGKLNEKQQMCRYAKDANEVAVSH